VAATVARVMSVSLLLAHRNDDRTGVESAVLLLANTGSLFLGSAAGCVSVIAVCWASQLVGGDWRKEVLRFTARVALVNVVYSMVVGLGELVVCVGVWGFWPTFAGTSFLLAISTVSPVVVLSLFSCSCWRASL
jgi:hypothetical protein